MAKFINAFTWKQAPDMSQLSAEQAWVREMMEKGLMLNLFLAADMSKGWVVWSVDSVDQIFKAMEKSPFSKFMNVTLTELMKD